MSRVRRLKLVKGCKYRIEEEEEEEWVTIHEDISIFMIISPCILLRMSKYLRQMLQRKSKYILHSKLFSRKLYCL
jgi:hypothetical protein